MAADSVQPVPCVWRVSTRGRAKRSIPVLLTKMSTAVIAAAVPALDQHGAAAERQQRLGLRDDLGLARGLAGFRAGCAASGRLGVIRVASGQAARA